MEQGRSPKGGNPLNLVHVNTAPQPAPGGRAAPYVAFDRLELALILTVYGRKVGKGEWRDYAVDFLKERAVFSIFARSSERPLYTVEKAPILARRQGQYMVSNHQGRILKRGHELHQVLRVLEPQLAVVR